MNGFKRFRAWLLHRKQARIEREITWILENYVECIEDLRRAQRRAASAEWGAILPDIMVTVGNDRFPIRR